MATHSSVLAWRIPGMGEPGGLPSMGSHRVKPQLKRLSSSSMDLTFQDLVQYFSLQHWTLLPSPVTSTAGGCFSFGSISSFFLQLVLQWSPAACWAPTNLASSSFSVLSFSIFTLFMGISRQEYWSGLLFPSPVYHILSDLSTMTQTSLMALHSTAHRFFELELYVCMNTYVHIYMERDTKVDFVSTLVSELSYKKCLL